MHDIAQNVRNRLLYLLSLLERAFWFSLPFFICLYVLSELKTLNTKQILIISIISVLFIKLRSLIKNRQLLSFEGDTFKSALAKEIMQIKFGLNDLYDNNVQCFPKQEDRFMEMNRKSFTKYWLAYHQYPKIAQTVIFDSLEKNYSAMIVLLRTDGNHDYDPLSDVNSLEESDFINLHSGGPQGYYKIKKLKVGDIVHAYLYDPESWGFLEPHEVEIKVVAIEEQKPCYEESLRHITFEIDRKHMDFGFEGEKIGKTITRISKCSTL